MNAWNCHFRRPHFTCFYMQEEIKHYLIWGSSIELYFLITCKNLIWMDTCVYRLFVSQVQHLWYQNGTVSNMTHHLQRGWDSSVFPLILPQIPLTSYIMNSIHVYNIRVSSSGHGKKYRFFFLTKNKTFVYFTKTLSIQDDCFLLFWLCSYETALFSRDTNVRLVKSEVILVTCKHQLDTT